jgi:hypothetical protein
MLLIIDQLVSKYISGVAVDDIADLNKQISLYDKVVLMQPRKVG